MQRPVDAPSSLSLGQLVDASHLDWVYFALFLSALQPTWWNLVARAEYRTHFLTKLFGGRPYPACYFLAVLIFLTSSFRDWVVTRAIESQPTLDFLGAVPFQIFAAISFLVGMTLVLSSTYQLGITGTFLGDYFGILMKERVTGFPFNVSNDPMYDGATLCFLGQAIWYKSPVGLLITLAIWICYRIAIIFEGSFTAFIYSQAAKAPKKSQ